MTSIPVFLAYRLLHHCPEIKCEGDGGGRERERERER